MKAYVLHEAGGAENLVLEDVEKPVPGPDDVLIETKAISINPVDFKVRGNADVMNMIMGTDCPVILGWDIAGTVAAVGDNVTQFAPGDSVFGMVNFPGHGKCYAEYVVAPAEQLATIPENTSFAAAAATTLAALTALQVLLPRVKAGDRALIHAGSGGVGHFAIQIAKRLGVHVASTSSARNKDFVVSLGADQHIDYRTQEFTEVLSGLDFVLDGMGGDVLADSLKIVRDGGQIVSLPTPEFSEDVTATAKARRIDVSFVLVQSNGSHMSQLASMLESGILKPHVSKTFSFDQMAEAHAQLESGRTVGKVVVTL